MDGKVRWLAFAAIALILVGGLAIFAPQSMPGSAAARKDAADRAARALVVDCTPNPHFEQFRGIGSDWQFLRNMSDGARAEFNPFTIQCNPQNGQRDVWVEIIHRQPQQASFEDETTIQKISYQRERYQFRLDCRQRQFALLEQRWMGDAREDTLHSERMDGELRPIEAGGVADALIGPACSTGRV
jgi:hypothetical protein